MHNFEDFILSLDPFFLYQTAVCKSLPTNTSHKLCNYICFLHSHIPAPWHCLSRSITAAGYVVRFDTAAGYAAIRKDAYVPAPDGYGRPCLQDYTRLGYVPADNDCRCSASVRESRGRKISDTYNEGPLFQEYI